jgi:predicted transcriptional regulator
MKDRMRFFGFEISKEVFFKLKLLAGVMERSVSSIVRQVLREYVEKNEINIAELSETIKNKPKLPFDDSDDVF